jgi:hypothetical protein
LFVSPVLTGIDWRPDGVATVRRWAGRAWGDGVEHAALLFSYALQARWGDAPFGPEG